MRKRKNLIPMVFLTLLSWSGIGYLMYAQSPNGTLPLPLPIDPKLLFFLLLFLAFLFSFSLLFQNTRRGILIAIGLTALTLLRFFHFFHPLYIVFIFALLLTLELYFVKSR